MRLIDAENFEAFDSTLPDSNSPERDARQKDSIIFLC